ncbi:MAG: hypothetical protein R6X02_20995 [Enhygromyxa sp.]
MWLPLGLVLGFALLDSPPIQRPGDPVVWAFEWEAPPECPSRAEVIDGIRGYLPLLDDPPASPSRAELRVIVSVAAKGPSWTATVRMSGRNGASERRFSAPACVELGDAVALISAVVLDPVLVAREVSARAEAAARAETSTQAELIAAPIEPPPAPPPQPESSDFNFDLVLSEAEAEPAPRIVTLGLGIHGTGAWGPTATGFGGLAGSFAVFADRWRWLLEGGWSIPRTLALDDGRRGQVQAWRIGTRGCVVPRVGVLELPSCAGAELGQVFARGLAPTTNTASASQLWAAAVLGQGLQWPVLPRLALSVEATVLVSLVRGSFLIGDQVFASITPLGFRAALGLETRF